VLAKRWTLTKTLGVGGTGTVYEAVHRNGRRVAVKVLHRELRHHPLIRRRFASEGYAANRVRHPNAVAVLDDGEELDGAAFLVMELLEGRSLAKVLSERGPLPVNEVVAAALATLDVLAAAHDNGVIHRDVKPANIFATVDGGFKLLDFGVAQVTDLVSSVITQSGGTVGTPAFMAPEQAAGRVHEIDALTDIWAVGATMFQLLTARFVHEVSSNNGTIVAAATVPAPRIRSIAPEIPAELAQIIDRALAFERSARWANARAMHLALRNACPEFAQVALVEAVNPETLPETEASWVEVPPSHVRRKPRLALLLTGPLLLLAALSVWLLLTRTPPTERSTRTLPSAAPRAQALPTAAAQPPAIPLPAPSSQPLVAPSAEPLVAPSNEPRVTPSNEPRVTPSNEPRVTPSNEPRVTPSRESLVAPSRESLVAPSREPLVAPSREPLVASSSEPPVVPSLPNGSGKPVPAAAALLPSASPQPKPVLLPSPESTDDTELDRRK